MLKAGKIPDEAAQWHAALAAAPSLEPDTGSWLLTRIGAVQAQARNWQASTDAYTAALTHVPDSKPAAISLRPDTIA